jgi:hypothetical protein
MNNFISLRSDSQGSCPDDKGNPFPLPASFERENINGLTMKEIILSQGKVALVDDEDYEYLNQWKWCAVKSRYTFYASRGIMRDGKWTSERMHRVILNPRERELIDHRDHDGLNNQKSNLRICTNGQNQMNKRPASATGYKGVYKDFGKYKASIEFNNKRLLLGVYRTPEEAALAYNEAAKKYHGEYANLNKVKI